MQAALDEGNTDILFSFEGAGKADVSATNKARWSSGQDGGLSRPNREFDSPSGHHPFDVPKKSFNIEYLATAIYIVGVFSGEGPPVPIPNTAVKLTCAENTCLETGREDR